MTKLLHWLDVPIHPELQQEYRSTAYKNESYTSRHRYSIEGFGITEDELSELLSSIPCGVSS